MTGPCRRWQNWSVGTLAKSQESNWGEAVVHRKEHLKAWWQPILEMPLEDPAAGTAFLGGLE
jgi:hypothetical protein